MSSIVVSGDTSGSITLSAPAVSGSSVLTLPVATDTLVGKATTDTLTNKTLTGAVMNGTVGATTPSTGAFTTVSATSSISASNNQNAVSTLATFNNNTQGTGAVTEVYLTDNTTGTMRFNVFSGSYTTAGLFDYASGAKIFHSGSGGLSVGASGGNLTLFSGSNSAVLSSTGLNSAGTVTATKLIPTGSSATGNGIYLPAANSVGLSTNGAERFRMNASGSAFFSGNYTVDYPGSGNTSTGIYLESAGQLCVSRDNTVAGRFNRNSSDGIVVSFARQGTEVGSVQITTTATSYVTSSDYRLKENISPMTGALAKVALLKPVTYKWKSNGSDGQGFIAHELQAVVPDCVTGEKDGTQMQPYQITPAIAATYDADGIELTPFIEAVMGEREVPKYQGIDTSFLVATLTAAIQELKAEVDSLKAQINGA